MNTEDKELAILNANIQGLVKSQAFKDVLWELLGMCDVYSSIPGKFEAGKRSVGLDIIAMLEDADPAIYPKLLLEHTNDR